MSNKALPVYVVNSTGGGGTTDAYSKTESDERFTQQTTFYNFAGGSSIAPPQAASLTYLTNTNAATTYATKTDVKNLKDDVASTLAGMMDDISDLYTDKENLKNKTNTIAGDSNTLYPSVTGVKNYVATASVSSLDNITGPVTLAGGANVTIANDIPNKLITISATGGGGGGTPVVPSINGISILNDTQAPSCSNVANHCVMNTGGTMTGTLTLPAMQINGNLINSIGTTTIGPNGQSIPTEYAVHLGLQPKIDTDTAIEMFLMKGNVVTEAHFRSSPDNVPSTQSLLLYTSEHFQPIGTYENRMYKSGNGPILEGDVNGYPSCNAVAICLKDYQKVENMETGSNVSASQSKYPSSYTVETNFQRKGNMEQELTNSNGKYPSSSAVYAALQNITPTDLSQYAKKDVRNAWTSEQQFNAIRMWDDLGPIIATFTHDLEGCINPTSALPTVWGVLNTKGKLQTETDNKIAAIISQDVVTDYTSTTKVPSVNAMQTYVYNKIGAKCGMLSNMRLTGNSSGSPSFLSDEIGSAGIFRQNVVIELDRTDVLASPSWCRIIESGEDQDECTLVDIQWSYCCRVTNGVVEYSTGAYNTKYKVVKSIGSVAVFTLLSGTSTDGDDVLKVVPTSGLNYWNMWWSGKYAMKRRTKISMALKITRSTYW